MTPIRMETNPNPVPCLSMLPLGGMFVLLVLSLAFAGAGHLNSTLASSVPQLASISPASATAGGIGFTLTLTGAGFLPSSKVQWNGSSRRTTFISGTRLTAVISAGDIATAGTASVNVRNGMAAVSNVLTFSIHNPVPGLSSLNPSTVGVGGTSFALTVNGAGFVPTSGMRWNNFDLTTTFVSSTQLTATITASDIANAGAVQVTAFNPTPGGGTSNALSFTITNPDPNLTSLSPPSVLAGGANFTLSITGAGFVSGSVVRWNGSDRPTVLVSSMQIAAFISASDILSAGTAQLTVFTPQPGGGPSNALAFAINNPPFFLASLSLANAPAGGPTFTLNATGSGFTSSSTVRWNGSDRATTFVSSSSLQAAIMSADIASVGTAQVSVFDTSAGTSNTLSFVITQDPVGVLERVSVATNGSQGNGSSSGGVASADGRFVAFTSEARNFDVHGINGFADVFLRDTCRGASAPVGCTPSTVQAALANDGSEAIFNVPTYDPNDGVIVVIDCNGGAHNANEIVVCVGNFVAAISADGRFVLFYSNAINLVANNASGFWNVYVRDTCQGAGAGCVPSTVLVSAASDGTPGNEDSLGGTVSADGRFVSFSSVANNLVANDTNGVSDVFLRDTCAGAAAGCTPSTVRVSVASDGTQGNVSSACGAISADGRFVAFCSDASNLVANDTNGAADIFVHDTCFNVAGCSPSTVRVSVASDGTAGNAWSGDPGISGDGRFIAFESDATNLVSNDTNGARDVFVHDTCLGASSGCVPGTTRVSVASDGTQANNYSEGSSLSADGRYIAFVSYATNLVAAADTNAGLDVFVRDTCAGAAADCTPSTVRASVASDGTQGNQGGNSAVLSANGQFVVFGSFSDNLVFGDTNGYEDCFLARTGR